MVAVKQLHDLQELDSEVAAAGESLAQVRTRLADDSALLSSKEQLSQLGARHEDLGSRHRAAERGISELQDKLSRVEGRLYGGAIRNPREMSAAEEERGFIQAQQREEEDALLELMVEMEDVESGLGTAQEVLAKLEAERPVEIAELTEREAQLTGELAGLAKTRGMITPHIMADLLSLYESLRESKGGQALARIERGTCRGCRLALSTAQLQRARSAQEIVQCGSCQSQLGARHEDLGSRHRAAERGISELQDKLSRVEGRLYGGAIRNPREMSAAEEERGFIQAQQREEEDALLELMVEMEDVESGLGTAQEVLAKLEAERPVEIAELTEREAQLTGELAGLAKTRGMITPHIMADLLSLYESLRESKGGQALARIERGTCRGCRLALSTAQLQRARSAQEIVQCGSCQRILYVV